MIQLNDFKRIWNDCGADVLAAVSRVGASGRYILGPEVAQFEAELGARLGGRQVIGCASGLDAIELALRALGITPGTKVLTTPLSAFATTLAIVRAGGVPCFTDIDDTGAISLEQADEFFARNSDCRWFVPVHLYGHPLNSNRLDELKRKYRLIIVEDCAQSIGASSCGRPTGTTGECSTFSFYPTKNLGAIGDGGAVTTGDPATAARLRMLRDYGQSSKYVHSELGLNSRLDELHAGIMRDAFFPKLSAWISRRQAVAEEYCSAFASAGINVARPARGERSVWHLFPLLLESPARRDAAAAYLKQQGVVSAVHYPVTIPRQPALASVCPALMGANFAAAERFAQCELSLPIHPYLSDDEVELVIAAVIEWSRR